MSASHTHHNIHVTIMDVLHTSKQGESDPKYISTVKVQVKTLEEGSISELIEIFMDERQRQAIEVLVTAKILKINQGNPALKTGIHVVAHEHIDKTGFKEWPGSSVDEDDEEQ